MTLLKRLIAYIALMGTALLCAILRSEALEAVALVFATHILLRDLLEGHALVLATEDDIIAEYEREVEGDGSLYNEHELQ